MQRCLVCFGSTESQTHKIAEYLGYALYKRGVDATIEACPTRIKVQNFDALVVGGAVEVGRLHPSVTSFIAKHRKHFERKSSFLFTVGLRPYLNYQQICEEEQKSREWMAQHYGWDPDGVANFDSALWYRRYGIYERWRMRNKARELGLDTDTRRNYEYTDWSAVDRFAQTVVDEYARAQSETDGSAGFRPARCA